MLFLDMLLFELIRTVRVQNLCNTWLSYPRHGLCLRLRLRSLRLLLLGPQATPERGRRQTYKVAAKVLLLGNC